MDEIKNAGPELQTAVLPSAAGQRPLHQAQLAPVFDFAAEHARVTANWQQREHDREMTRWLAEREQLRRFRETLAGIKDWIDEGVEGLR